MTIGMDMACCHSSVCVEFLRNPEFAMKLLFISQVMEYREDLLYYYYAGYGNDLNRQLGCHPVKDFLDRFR
jgi:hypothetical protein